MFSNILTKKTTMKNGWNDQLDVLNYCCIMKKRFVENFVVFRKLYKEFAFNKYYKKCKMFALESTPCKND